MVCKRLKEYLGHFEVICQTVSVVYQPCRQRTAQWKKPSDRSQTGHTGAYFITFFFIHNISFLHKSLTGFKESVKSLLFCRVLFGLSFSQLNVCYWAWMCRGCRMNGSHQSTGPVLVHQESWCTKTQSWSRTESTCWHQLKSVFKASLLRRSRATSKVPENSSGF